MFTLEIKNFQSIEKLRIKLSGFTAITGPSNLGKSAIRRAIGVILYNDWDASWLRNDTDSCTLSLAKDDGSYRITVTKPDNSYKIEREGHEDLFFGKVGTKVPEEVSALGFHTLAIPNEELQINVSKQLDPLFMVSYKDASNTAILNRLFNVTKLEGAQTAAAKDKRIEVMERNRSSNSYEEKKQELDLLDTKLDAVEGEATKANTMLTDLKQIITFTDSLCSQTEVSKSLNELRGRLSYQIQVESVARSIKQVTDYIELRLSLSESCLRQEQTEEKIKSLESKRNVSEDLLYIGQYLAYDDKLVEVTKDLSTVTSKLDSFPNLGDFSSLNNYLSLVEDEIQVNSALILAEEKVDSFPDFEGLRSISNYLIWKERIVAHDASIAVHERELEKANAVASKASEVLTMVSYLEDLKTLDSYKDQQDQIVSLIKDQQDKIAALPKCEACGQLHSHSH